MRCPAATPSTIGDGRGLHRPLEHLGIRHDRSGGLTGGTFRRLTASTGDDDVDPAYLPAGQRLRLHLEPPDQVERQPGARPQLLRARRIRARDACFNLHTMDADGGNVTQISFNQSHDRNPVGAPERRHHVLALGSRRPAATTSRSSAPSRTAPTCSCSTARTAAGNSFLHPRDMDPNGQVRRLARVRPDAAVAHARRRRADVHRRRQLLRAEHAGRRPGVPAAAASSQVTQQALNLGRGLSQLRSRHHAVSRCGTAPTACCVSYRPARSRATASSSRARR